MAGTRRMLPDPLEPLDRAAAELAPPAPTELEEEPEPEPTDEPDEEEDEAA